MNELLQDPPYLQLAINIPDLFSVGKFLAGLNNPPSTKLLLKIGTPLIKNEGIRNIIPIIRKIFPQIYLLADLQSLEFVKLEVEFSVKTGVDSIVISGYAPFPIIKNFVNSCKQRGVDAWVDSMGIDLMKFSQKIDLLEKSPEVIIVRCEEALSGEHSAWEQISVIKKGTGSLIAAAGGLNLDNIRIAKDSGVDIFIIGREIYQAENPQSKIDDFLSAIS